MTLSRLLARMTGLAARRPLHVTAGVLLAAVAGAALALFTLSPATDTSTLVGKGSDSYQAGERFRAKFGDDAIYVLVEQPLRYTVLTADLQRVLGLEGCISGNAPKDRTPPGGTDGPCAQLARTKPVQVVFGPGTFLNESVGQIQDQFQAQNADASARAKRAGEAARKLARERGWSKARVTKAGKDAEQLVFAEYTRNVLQLALKYGITGIPRLNDPNFVSSVVFDETKPAGTPKGRFAYIFPTKDAALVQVRLKPGLSPEQRDDAIALVRAATRMKDWQLTEGKGKYVVTGAPVVVSDLTAEVSSSTVRLLIGALVVMALTLVLVFVARLRLLPLAVALAATAIVFGLLALVGGTLTMAAIGVLPILIGLAVDYAIQVQSRLEEEDGDVAAVARAGAPTIAVAALATAAGFLVLLLSPVPMVRSFGLLLVVGVPIALACSLLLGVAVWTLARRRGTPVPVPGIAALRGARELLVDNPVSRGVGRLARRAGGGALAAATQRPARVLGIALAIAALGWVLDTQSRVESDVTKLVPQSMPALQDLTELEEQTGIGGEVDLVVTSDDLTDPAVVAWMTKYQRDLNQRFGYSATRGCGEADLCPAFSLPDLFGTGEAAKTREGIRALLDAVPPYFSRGVITSDRKTANLAFGVKLLPLEEQQRVFDVMRERLEAVPPPKGTTVELTGLPVIAAEANAAVASHLRRIVTLLLGLLAVAAVLLLAFRGDRRRALVPLVPIVLATGWSALVLFATRIPLNPMSVTLGALVIAITTEFSVLLSERYRRERRAGRDTPEALRAAYRSTGAAVLASGATAIAGFAVLVLSDIRLLRDFGALTVVDLAVSLLGVLVVLPSVLVLAEQGRLGVPARLRRVRPPRLRRPGRREAAPAR